MSGIATVNPATGITEREFEPMTDTAVDAAVRASNAAYVQWRGRPVAERAELVGRAARLMLERTDELAALMTLEMGKLAAESAGEVELAASILTYYAEQGPAMLQDRPIEVSPGTAVVQTRPLGPLLGVMPWNFPLYQVVRFAGPNLVAGNTILLKHASSCPQSAIALERLFRDAGLPAGVYTNLLVPGSGIARIIENPLVQGASLTGSEPAGRSVGEVAGRNLKKVVLELGGSDPMVILDGIDLDRTVEAAPSGRMSNSGQSCVAAKRFIVLEPAYDVFVSAMATAMQDLKPGDPADPETTLGPMSSEAAAAEIADQVAEAVQHGATAVIGGSRIDRPGAYMAPTILTDVTPDMRAYSEELFGPVAVIHRVADEEAAIGLANDSTFGLGASVLGHDEAQAARVANALDVGMLWINHPTATAPNLPFGGIKRSGIGRELADLGIAEFVNKRLVRTLPADTSITGAAG